MPQNKLAVIILAAGKGTRMKSPLAKVLQPLSGKTLLHHVLETVGEIDADRVGVVVGFQADKVKSSFPDLKLEFIEQKEQLGTGHAAQQTESCFKDFEGDILLLCGDMPLIRASTLKNLIKIHRQNQAACTLLTLKDKTGEIKDFGRILRDDDQSITRIVENKDATEQEKKVDEYNSGIYCFDREMFYKALHSIKNSNSQNEYYLTDTIKYFVQNKCFVQSVQTEDSNEILGINSPEDLKRAEQLLSR